MTSESKKIWQYFQTIFFISFVFIGLSLVVSIFQTPKYKASSKILVLAKVDKGFDSYVANQTSEYIVGILSEVIYSASFLNEVFASGFFVNENYFGSDALKRSLVWKETVVVTPQLNGGVLEVVIYHPDKNQALQITSAISYVLLNKGINYYGVDKVDIKVIDPPTVSTDPVSPNLLLNLLVGFLVGIMAGIGFIYLFPGVFIQFWGGIKKVEDIKMTKINSLNSPVRTKLEDQLAKVIFDKDLPKKN